MTRRPFDFLVVGSPMHDAASLRRAIEPTIGSLVECGGREVEVLYGDRPAVIVVATGGTEAAILRLHAAKGAPAGPLLLVTHPAHNSLPAALETLARVQQDGGRGRIVHLPSPDDAPSLARLRSALDDLRVHERLRKSRIGLVGAPSDWLVASVPEAYAVRETWGPETVSVDLAPLLAAADALPDRAASDLAASFSGGAAATREPKEAAIARAAAVTGALSALMEASRLEAVAVRCFDLVTGPGTSGCLALSALNDAGRVAACEGDLASAVAMLWIHELLGTASWMANPAHADPGTGLLRLAHCTIPRSLVTRFELRSHFESGLGVALAGELPAGAMTLVRLGGRRLERLFLAEGETAPSERREDLCRTQVDLRLAPSDVAELLDRPLGNHVVLVPGRHAARLRGWWEWAVA